MEHVQTGEREEEIARTRNRSGRHCPYAATNQQYKSDQEKSVSEWCERRCLTLKSSGSCVSGCSHGSECQKEIDLTRTFGLYMCVCVWPSAYTSWSIKLVFHLEDFLISDFCSLKMNHWIDMSTPSPRGRVKMHQRKSDRRRMRPASKLSVIPGKITENSRRKDTEAGKIKARMSTQASNAKKVPPTLRLLGKLKGWQEESCNIS